MRLLFSLITCLGFSACATSLVYDPSLQMPAGKLEPGDAQVAAGAAYLLETRPDTLGRMGVVGTTLQVRGAFSERVTVGLKHWFALTELSPGSVSNPQEKYYRGGLGAELAIALSERDQAVAWSILGRGAMLFGEGSMNNVQIDGGGFAAQAMAGTLVGRMRLTGALGPVFGFRDLVSNDEAQWGAGAIANFGAAIRIAGGFDVIADVAGLVYYDANREEAQAAVSPALSLSYSF